MKDMTPAHDMGADKRSRRRRGLAVGLVAAGAIAAAPGIATLAGFTAQDVNEDNSITAGTLDVAFGKDAKHFDVANMKPGDKTSQTVKVSNTGSLAEEFSLDAVGVEGALDDVLEVEVAKNGRTQTKDTKVSEMPAIENSLDAGETATYEVTISWPGNDPSVDNAYQGSGITFDLQVDADQFGGRTLDNGANPENGQVPRGDDDRDRDRD